MFNLSEKQVNLINERNRLIDEQEQLKVHNYRTEGTELTEDDKKFDELQVRIDEINTLIG